ncbi:hypothetical protein [Scandinavium sp.]|uniref:hypothetical protein n=1 Tax=Scandinavium sp. TaxID=2830653 RepID=UPI0028A12B2C|nr:hypothetical protein [Scandinavium sp.]
MNSLLRNKHVLWSGIIILLLLMTFCILVFYKAEKKSLKCLSMIHKALPEQAVYLSSVLTLSESSKGSFFFKGTLVGKKTGKLNLERQVTFEYSSPGDSRLILAHFNTSRGTADNVPDEVFNRSVFDTASQSTELYLTKLNNVFLLNNIFMPVQVCVPE